MARGAGLLSRLSSRWSLRRLLAEGSSWKVSRPRSSRFRSAFSLSCTRCWPWQGTVLKVISALGLELHVTAARCQLRRRARRWLSNQPPTRVDRPPYTLCYAIPVRCRAGVGWSRHGGPCPERPTCPGSPGAAARDPCLAWGWLPAAPRCRAPWRRRPSVRMASRCSS